MLKFTTETHSKLIRGSLIGFGVGNAMEIVRSLITLNMQRGSSGELFFAVIALPLIISVAALMAGLVNFDSEEPVRGLLLFFVIVAFTAFPLGTLLSVYVLVYVFHISVQNAKTVAENESES